MFHPSRCPYELCEGHRHPFPGFAVRFGAYWPKCRNHPVPRFRCRLCRRTFSRQTFRADYLQKKPHLNGSFLRLMVSCVGLRQAARVLRVARRTVEHRFEWLAEHARHYHENRLRPATLCGPFQMDELESFEGNRFQPVTVPILIERGSFFIIGSGVAPLRRKGRLTPSQRRRRKAHELLHGRRPSTSGRAVKQVLKRLDSLAPPRSAVVLESDRKPLYGKLGRQLFGSRFQWKRFSATARRDRSNPLFPINHTHARLRHFLARLRRRTWCVSKRREALGAHLAIATLWSNYSRGVTNRTRISPAQALGVASRAYRAEELMGWREDWGELSPARAA